MKNRKRILSDIWYCFKGGKAHKAYPHSNVGADIIWCEKHGVLASHTAVLTYKKINKGISEKQMTKKQYKKFVLEKMKK